MKILGLKGLNLFDIFFITLQSILCMGKRNKEMIPIKNIDLNPLSPNTDQRQFSPYDIHAMSRDQAMRINKRSPKGKCLDLLSNSLNSFMKEMYGDQFGEIICGYWGLKG